MVKNLHAIQETRVQSLGREDPLEKEVAAHSSILAWRIPWTEEPGGLQSTGHKESDTTEPLALLLLWVSHLGGVYMDHVHSMSQSVSEYLLSAYCVQGRGHAPNTGRTAVTKTLSLPRALWGRHINRCSPVTLPNEDTFSQQSISELASLKIAHTQKHSLSGSFARGKRW